MAVGQTCDPWRREWLDRWDLRGASVDGGSLMGTNFYWYGKPPCPHCGHIEAPRHIGKSSAGWVFALHVYPDDGIKDLTDWARVWGANREGKIKDEYGREITPAQMLGTIMLRGREDPPTDFDYRGNKAERAPCNLIRSCIGGSTISHGAGTWDCHIGEFS